MISVTKRERFYFLLSLIISLLIYAVLLNKLWFGFTSGDKQVIGRTFILAMYAFGFLTFSFVVHALFIGHVRGNGIRISDRQFPEVHNLAKQIAERMKMKLPPIFVLGGNGMLNAFATRFLGRNYVIILSDVFELAYEQGEDELAFVLAHELAHIKRKHVAHHFLLLPSKLVPFLGKAYSRACEYTCDATAALAHPKGKRGLLCIAAGSKLYKQASVSEYLADARDERGFWVWFSEILSTHPHLPKRIERVFEKVEVSQPLEIGATSRFALGGITGLRQ